MCRIMIVEDETVFRDGLRRNIDWAGNGFAIVAEADNGEQALRLIRDIQPDIVISDIIMPGMDGLTLAERIREEWPHIKVIMLTVLDDFSELHRSLRAQVTDYVLKFRYQEELLPAVRKASRILEHERVLLAGGNRPDYADVSLLRECVLGNLSPDAAAELLARQHPELAQLPCAVALASAQFPESGEETQLYLTLQCELKNLRYEALKSYIIDLGSGICLVLFLPAVEDAVLLRCGRTVLRRVREKHPEYTALRIGVGGPCRNPAELLRSFDEAQLALEMTRLANTDLLFHTQLQGEQAAYRILMQKAAAYIDAHYQNSAFSLKEAAEELYLSPSYLSTVFKRVFGIGFNEYLTVVRLGHVRDLLENTALKTYEIADRVGYTNPQYMSILFKRHFGCSPGEYRRRCGGMPDADAPP